MKNKRGQKILSVIAVFVILLGLIAAANQTYVNTTSKNSTENNPIAENYSGNPGTMLVPLENITTVPKNISDANLSNETDPTPAQNISEKTINETKVSQNQTVNETNSTKISNPKNNSIDNRSGVSTIQTSEATYVPLETRNTPFPKNNSENETKVKVMLTKDNEVQVEGNLPASFNINNINKKEIKQNDSSKEVIVSSPIHVTDPLTVYSDIPEISPSQKDSVSIYWKNENKSIVPNKFYDTNGDGKYDRVSWIVPHLSTQIFQINVDVYPNPSPSLFLYVTNPQNGSTLSNPLNFSVSTSYPNFTCNGSIFNTANPLQNISINFNQSQNFTTGYLDDQDYNWNLDCYDLNQTLINDSSGYFTINQGYSLTGWNSSYYFVSSDGTLINPPSDSTIHLNANIDYQNNFSLYRDGSVLTNQSATGPNTFEIGSYVNQPGNYTLIGNFSDGAGTVTTIKRYFSVLNVSIESVNSAYASTNTTIKVKITAPAGYPLSGDVVKFGDESGTNYTDWSGVTGTSQISDTFIHNYTSPGTYTIRVRFKINGNETVYFEKPISIQPQESQAPSIEMISPANNEVIGENETFSYKLKGDVSGIKYCNLSFEGPQQNSTYPPDYVYNWTSTSNNQVDLQMAQFVEGGWRWYVNCTDSSDNLIGGSWSPKYFTVSFTNTTYHSNYSQKPQVELATAELNNFTSKDYSFEDIQAMEDLGIWNTTRVTFQRQLINIDQFFGGNINYITDNATKQKRIQENQDLLDSITNNIPLDIRVTNQEQFTKNSMSQNMEGIVKAYAANNSIPVTSRDIANLAKMNQEVQKYISVSTNARDVSIKYANRTEDITLITKTVKITNNSYGTVIEALPSDMKNVVFITKAQKIGDGLYELSTQDIENTDGKIIYYTTTPVNSDLVKQADTLLFQLFDVTGNGLTGFSVRSLAGEGSFWIYPSIILGLVFLFLISKKLKLEVNLVKWKKEEDVMRVLDSVDKARRALKEEDNTEIAKVEYHRIRGLFVLVPKGFRVYIRPELEKIRKGIDRRDIIGFVREYDKAKMSGRGEDARRLYQEIKSTYKRLSKKDQEKIYNKMFKSNWEI